MEESLDIGEQRSLKLLEEMCEVTLENSLTCAMEPEEKVE